MSLKREWLFLALILAFLFWGKWEKSVTYSVGNGTAISYSMGIGKTKPKDVFSGIWGRENFIFLGLKLGRNNVNLWDWDSLFLFWGIWDSIIFFLGNWDLALSHDFQTAASQWADPLYLRM